MSEGNTGDKPFLHRIQIPATITLDLESDYMSGDKLAAEIRQLLNCVWPLDDDGVPLSSIIDGYNAKLSISGEHAVMSSEEREGEDGDI